MTEAAAQNFNHLILPDLGLKYNPFSGVGGFNIASNEPRIIGKGLQITDYWLMNTG